MVHGSTWPSYQLNQCWVTVNWTSINKGMSKFNPSYNIFTESTIMMVSYVRTYSKVLHGVVVSEPQVVLSIPSRLSTNSSSVRRLPVACKIKQKTRYAIKWSVRMWSLLKEKRRCPSLKCRTLWKWTFFFLHIWCLVCDQVISKTENTLTI